MAVYFRPKIDGPELTLQDAVLKRATKLLFENERQDRIWTGCSVPIGSGLPDLLIASWRKNLSVFAAVELQEAELLAYLRIVRNATAETIVKELHWPEARVTRVLSNLRAANAISVTARKIYSVARIWKAILPDVVAVEVKVTDWQGAVRQAARNTLFTHRSYVALPARAAVRIRQDSFVRRFGIGLLGIDENKSVKVVRKARRTRPKLWGYYYKVAMFVKRFPMSCPI